MILFSVVCLCCVALTAIILAIHQNKKSNISQHSWHMVTDGLDNDENIALSEVLRHLKKCNGISENTNKAKTS